MKNIRCLLGPAFAFTDRSSTLAVKQWIFVSAVNECMELN
jgi:hypothetical protein